ncbi:MAG: 4Fe-4S binding protein [Kiritimatiellae bacterium]|nr:4Fe-4S binding protein [Kiritimatiellia bacterium]
MSEPVTRKLMLFFPTCECEKPIIYHLVKDYDLLVNVFRAKVTPKEEGYLVLDVTGMEANIDRALDYLRTFNITINDTGKGLTWDEKRCCHCGHCVAFCPTGALKIPDPATREVTFDGEACIECLACIRVCPYGACVSTF